MMSRCARGLYEHNYVNGGGGIAALSQTVLCAAQTDAKKLRAPSVVARAQLNDRDGSSQRPKTMVVSSFDAARGGESN